jgi:hypothetical protein
MSESLNGQSCVFGRDSGSPVLNLSLGSQLCIVVSAVLLSYKLAQNLPLALRSLFLSSHTPLFFPYSFPRSLAATLLPRLCCLKMTQAYGMYCCRCPYLYAGPSCPQLSRCPCRTTQLLPLSSYLPVLPRHDTGARYVLPPLLPVPHPLCRAVTSIHRQLLTQPLPSAQDPHNEHPGCSLCGSCVPAVAAPWASPLYQYVDPPYPLSPLPPLLQPARFCHNQLACVASRRHRPTVCVVTATADSLVFADASQLSHCP